MRLGLGFSEAGGVRRPQILALPPGTLTKVEHKYRAGPSTLLKALLGLGFATLYKRT